MAIQGDTNDHLHTINIYNKCISRSRFKLISDAYDKYRITSIIPRSGYADYFFMINKLIYFPR